MQLAEIEAKTTIEAKTPQLIFQLFRLLLHQSIQKILHSDWLNLSGRDSPLTARESIVTKHNGVSGDILLPRSIPLGDERYRKA